MERAWGACTIDRFATANNAQLPRYNSKYRDPHSENVDSLSLPDGQWLSERNWCNPPWELLPELVTKLRISGAPAHVVAPEKPGAWWYRELVALSTELRVIAPQVSTFYPASQGSRAPIGAPSWNVTVFRIEGRPRGRR